MWTRPWEDTAVAFPPIPSGSSGHREQPRINRNRIWIQKPAVIQACRWHRFIHGLDRWCLRWVITWIPRLRLYAERDCETGRFYYFSPWPVDHYHIWSEERLELMWTVAVSFPVICWLLPYMERVRQDLFRPGVARVRLCTGGAGGQTCLGMDADTT